MSSTYLSLHYHIVFSTKERRNSIPAAECHRLHEYLGGVVRGLDGFPHAIGGVQDHVHLLVGLKSTHCLADAVREIKKASSVWLRDEVGLPDFQWQSGYAAFTVSATALDSVRRYVNQQEEHHRTVSSSEELLALLERAGISYDPRFFE